MTAPVLIWGFEGTTDHRIALTAEEFGELGMSPPPRDSERFISRGELRLLLARIKALKGTLTPVAGGSPLLAAMVAAECAQMTSLAAADVFFAGAVPALARGILGPPYRDVLAFADVGSDIAGSVCLEYAPASTCLILAVPDGRWLDSRLGAAAAGGLGLALTVTRADCAMLAIGGLNKAEPSVASQLVREFRASVARPAVFVAGNSFAPEATRSAGYTYWADLFQLMANADFVSVSADEDAQLSCRWGDTWKASLMKWSTRAVFIHSIDGIEVLGDDLIDHHQLRRLITAACELESRGSDGGLTGLRARRDGVLSALLTAQVAESDWLRRLSAAPAV